MELIRSRLKTVSGIFRNCLRRFFRESGRSVETGSDSRTAQTIREKLMVCAKQLDKHLDRTRYPRMYCDYFWGTTFKDGTASMGAQASGASLMEGVARLETAQ